MNTSKSGTKKSRKRRSPLTPKTEAEVKRLLKTYPPELVRAVGKALLERASEATGKRRGRRREDDSDLYKKIAERMVNEGDEEEDAIQRIIEEEVKEHNRPTVSRRVARNFPVYGRPFLEEAKLKAALERSTDRDEAADVLQEYITTAVRDVRESEDRETAVDVLKIRLMAVIDEVVEALDAAELARSLGQLTRPFNREDIERAFDEEIETWDL